MVGDKAAERLAGIRAAVLQFEETVKVNHGVLLYKSGYVDRYVKELERREKLQPSCPPQKPNPAGFGSEESPEEGR